MFNSKFYLEISCMKPEPLKPIAKIKTNFHILLQQQCNFLKNRVQHVSKGSYRFYNIMLNICMFAQ